jgi:hypothetical protein
VALQSPLDKLTLRGPPPSELPGRFFLKGAFMRQSAFVLIDRTAQA